MVEFNDLIEKLFQIYTQDAFSRYDGDYYLSTPSDYKGCAFWNCYDGKRQNVFRCSV